MIQKLTLTDFKSHAHTEIPLGRFTVLVGPNGSGKTSVLTALHFALALCRPASLKPPVDAWGPELLGRLGTAFTVHLHATGWALTYAVRSAGAGRRVDVTHLPATESDQKDRDFNWLLNKGIHFAQAPTVRLLQLSAPALARPTDPAVNLRLGDDGAGLATVLANLRLGDNDRFEAIVADLRLLVPSLARVDVEPISEGNNVRYRVVATFTSGARLPAFALSGGTLIALGMLTLIHTEGPAGLLLLDDFEQSLHPRAQWELVAILRRMLDQHPELQIVATSHSPYLVDKFAASEVVVTALDPRTGISHCRLLSEHPAAAEYLKYMKTGEFLSAEGEDWVIEAHPVTRWLVFCQAADEFHAVSTLSDRLVITERPWADGVLEHLRSWIGEPQAGELRFVNFAALKDRPATHHGTYEGNKAELNLALKAITAAFLPPWRADGLILFRDADPKPPQPDRRAAIEHARRLRPDEEQRRICLAVALPEREAWYVAGFVPNTPEEQARLEAERQRHGGWPHEESHRLLAGKEWDEQGRPIPRNVKHVLRALTAGDGVRRAECIEVTDLNILRARGQQNGLAAFLADFAATLLHQIAPGRAG